MLKYLKILALLPIFALGYGVYFVYGIGDNTGYAPEQPFNFNHELHAGQMEIPCQYCHFGVSQNRAALVPGLSVCMNCHSVVANDKPNIQKLKQMFQTGDKVEWTKVHDLPDFVYFSHSPHIMAGLECAACHGKVEEMKRVRQEHSLAMGWCLDCHRGNDENGKPRNGPTECSDCHN